MIVRKRQRRLGEVDEIVLSLYARGLTTGEIAAHFEQIYGASVRKETVSRITDARKLRAAGVQEAAPTVDKHVTADRWQAADEPIAAAVAEIAGLARDAIRMGRRLRDLAQTGGST